MRTKGLVLAVALAMLGMTLLPTGSAQCPNPARDCSEWVQIPTTADAVEMDAAPPDGHTSAGQIDGEGSIYNVPTGGGAGASIFWWIPNVQAYHNTGEAFFNEGEKGGLVVELSTHGAFPANQTFVEMTIEVNPVKGLKFTDGMTRTVLVNITSDESTFVAIPFTVTDESETGTFRLGYTAIANPGTADEDRDSTEVSVHTPIDVDTWPPAWLRPVLMGLAIGLVIGFIAGRLKR